MTPFERDLLTRTIIGEAGGEPPEGQLAVANVVLNRLRRGGYGNDVGAVVLRPHQFEAWSDPQKMMSYSPSSPEYSRAQAAIDEALLGNDPTQGAVNFYNPALQAELGRPNPTWAKGPGERIGNHVFYGGGAAIAQNDDPFSQAFGNPQAAATNNPAPTAESSPSGAGPDPFSQAFGNPEAGGAPQMSRAPGPPSSTPEQSEDTRTPLQKALAPVNAFVSGMARGVPVIGPSLEKGLHYAASGGRLLSGEKPAEAEQGANALAARARAEHPIAATAGEITGAIGGGGALVAAAPETFGVGLPLAAGVVRGAISGAGLGAADAAARGQDAGVGALAGGIGGAVANPLGMGMSRLWSSSVQPEVARLADLALNKFNIPLSADQLSSNPMIRFGSSVVNKFPMSGGRKFEDVQRGAFTRAVAGMMGENADALTPQVMSRARTRIGNDFEYAANNTPKIGADQQFGNDLQSIVADMRSPADREVTAGEKAVIEKQLRNVVDLFKTGNGEISGQQYQQLTRKGTALDKALNSDNPNIRYYASQIKDALDGALSRFVPSNAVDVLNRARRQWWTMKTVEDLAEKAPLGQISPALLLGAVRRSAPSVAYQTNNDLMDLGRIGQVFMKPPPSSGTAERSWIMHLLETLGLAGAGQFATHHVLGAAAGFAAPSVIGRGTGMVLRNQGLTNALVRGAMSTAPRLGGQIAAQASVPYAARKLLPNYLEKGP